MHAGGHRCLHCSVNGPAQSGLCGEQGGASMAYGKRASRRPKEASLHSNDRSSGVHGGDDVLPSPDLHDELQTGRESSKIVNVSVTPALAAVVSNPDGQLMSLRQTWPCDGEEAALIRNANGNNAAGLCPYVRQSIIRSSVHVSHIQAAGCNCYSQCHFVHGQCLACV